MGTGKTVTAKALSKQLKMRYVSIDALIEKSEKRLIVEIFAKDGEEYFRKIESEMIKNVSEEQNVVIDAGGGAVIKEENIKNFKKNGAVVCLTARPDVILERTKNQKHRPLLNVPDPKKKIEGLLVERAPYYKRADVTINTSDMTPDEVAQEIEKKMHGQ
jgi:shikimate kinase